MDAMLSKMWDPMPSIHDRFPDKEGALLREAVDGCYLVRTATIMPFANGNLSAPLLTRHPRNQRVVSQSQEDLVQNMLKDGFQQGVGGTLMATESDRQGHYLLLAGGTRCDAFAEAVRRQPTNAQLLATVSTGIKNVAIYSRRLPNDVADYLKLVANNYHEGASTTFLELLDSIDDWNKMWLSHARLEGISLRGGDAESLAWIYIKKLQKTLPESQRIHSFNQFQAARSFMNQAR
jgi:hypothetical protein